MVTSQEVLDFWFSSEPKKWFSKIDAFDATIRFRFGMTLEDARHRRLAEWEGSAKGLLALIIVLDQFSRNLYRGMPQAFSHDAVALSYSHALVKHADWDGLSPDEKAFAVMPMMHAEDIGEQQACLKWMEEIGGEGYIDAAKTHKNIIERFARFPHRNRVLGRYTTPEEKTFLDEGGFSG
ncbi:DUF924 family protein [Cohaesibacter celericrescens]|uniref:DUF924 domain-containing protein n=1 Tax=Cohaesibacter celericrescens TaxID=2067669 RepID=A0A2N5XU91_9HYPH|nr:DUF924 family protein [Cohaesibacter celericrescens]PLW78086.1 DUF924 domain-containing protein [Cohaesibacter celericrescens]